MGIRARLDDALFLYHNDRRDGALLNVLVALAATSRRRYPREKYNDKVAFVRFVADEMPVITGGVKNLIVRVPGGETVEFPDGLMPLGECLYRFVRCTLAHEATLPNNVEFIATESGKISVGITDAKIRLSDSFMKGLIRAVIYAPENADVFRDVIEIPPEVVALNLFGKRRDSHPGYIERREDLAQRLGKGAS